MSSLNRGWTYWHSTSGHVTVASWANKGGPWWIQNQTSIQVHHWSPLLDHKDWITIVSNISCSATYVGETGSWESVWQSTEGQSRTRIIRMELPCMSKRLRIPSTGRKQRSYPWEEGKLGERFLKPLWFMDPFCLPRKRQSRDQQCCVSRSNPYLGRTSFCSTSTCWWQPPGSKHPSDAESSSTDCVSKCSWIQKNYPKIIWIQRSPKSQNLKNSLVTMHQSHFYRHCCTYIVVNRLIELWMRSPSLHDNHPSASRHN